MDLVLLLELVAVHLGKRAESIPFASGSGVQQLFGFDHFQKNSRISSRKM